MAKLEDIVRRVVTGFCSCGLVCEQFCKPKKLARNTCSFSVQYLKAVVTQTSLGGDIVIWVRFGRKTRSGKLLRRSMQALAEGREPGDLTTLDDPASLDLIRNAIAQWRKD